MLTIDPKNTKTSILHSYLLSAVAPRPIAFASTMDTDGNPNLSPFSFFNVFSANPPIAVFSPARRGRDNTTKHTFENIKETMEVVINMVSYDMVQQMSLSSTEYAKGVNEFEKSGFTPLKSDLVKPFRVKESPVQMECTVIDIIELGDSAGAGNLIICEIIKMHISEEVLNENQMIDPFKIDLVARMGANWYCRASGDALFEVEKPLATIGIGYDKIPKNISSSSILTGNDLGKLGNVEKLPDETEVNEFKLMELSEFFIKLKDNPEQLEQQLHKMAKTLLDKGQVMDAWKTLLAFNG
ncbi:MAG: flavin reductase family protein [Bacteroidetes bacterium]|nr:flavin reductase family protein [Bacteroidota bacterium]HET6243495.1 flavin reductase family protein [Bacteroidia bacterium]